MTSRWVVCFRFTVRVSTVSVCGGEFGDEFHLLDGPGRLVHGLQVEEHPVLPKVVRKGFRSDTAWDC